MAATEIGLTEAAHRLGRTYQQTLRLALLGRLPATRREGHWYVRASDVEQLAKELETGIPAGGA